MKNTIIGTLICAPLFTLASEYNCSALAISCGEIPCHIQFQGEEDAPLLSPWSTNCFLSDSASVKLEPDARTLRPLQFHFATQQSDSMVMQLNPRLRDSPIFGSTLVRKTTPWEFSTIVGSHLALRIGRAWTTGIKMESLLLYPNRELQTQLLWQPFPFPWTSGIGIGSRMQREQGLRGSYLFLTQSSAFSAGPCEGRARFEFHSHSYGTPQQGEIMGPAIRFATLWGIPVRAWTPQLGFQAEQALIRSHAKTWKKGHPQWNWNAGLRLEAGDHWTWDALLSGPIVGDAAFEFHFALAWGTASPIKTMRLHKNQDHKDVSNQDTAWLASADADAPSTWDPAWLQNQGRRLPRLLEWQVWMQNQAHSPSDTSCPIGSGEWVLPDDPRSTILIRTGSPCAHFPEDWEALPLNSEATARPRWWYAIPDH